MQLSGVEEKVVSSDYDYIIVGAGITGLTIARLKAEEDKKCLILEKRDHIGGNAYSEKDIETGIEVHKYGAHLFHTDDDEVWQFVQRFSGWSDYVHRVWTTHKGEVFPLPINLGTINQFFRAHYTPDEAKQLVSVQAGEIGGKTPENLEEQGISLIGRPLFDAFIKNYTAKQWQIPASELSPSIINRLPVRYDYNNRYFANKYEGLPIDGYKKFFENIADHENIEIVYNTDFLRFDSNLINKVESKIIYTGPIDQFFDYQFGELKWRSLRFEREAHSVDDYQGCPVMNYADLEPEYTRIHEFKHFHPERIGDDKWPGYSGAKTVIVKEYPASWQRGDEPYYPVNTASDAEVLAAYRSHAAKTYGDKLVFAGRLGNYAYYDMDKAFSHAFKVAKEV